MSSAVPSAPLPTAAYLNVDRGSHIVAASIVLLILPTIVVGLRMTSRWMSKAGFWWDDLFILVALIFSWGPNISNLYSVHAGLGRHLEAIDRPQLDVLTDWFKRLYAFEFSYNLAVSTLKFSIIFFMYRIFPIIHFRRICIAAHIFVFCFSAATILVSIFQCVPIHDFWDTLGGRLLSPQRGGRCVDSLKYFLVVGGINTATDFILLALPIPLLWRLRTSNIQKLILTIIFVFGLTVCAVSITRLVVLSNLREDDLTWNYVNPAIWTAAETSIGVVSACLPSLRPLFVRLVWGSSYRPTRIAHSSQRSYGGSSWLGRSKEMPRDRSDSFNRLRDTPDGSVSKPWVHNVNVTGGRAGDSGSEEYVLGGTGAHSPRDVPNSGIRVRTTVTVTERVDWQDSLF